VEGLRAFLRGTPTQLALCHTVHQALTLMERRLPRLVLVDWHLADAPGTELMIEAQRRGLKTSMLCLIEPGPHRLAQETQAMGAGAAGCVLYTATREAVLEAVAEALDHRIEPEVARSMGELVQRTAPRTVLLTPQERVVLRLMRQQLTYKEIAIELSVSWHTIRSHAQSILRKLGIHSRRDLATWDARLGAVIQEEEVAVA
jgi:two-component system nitrate/nitrite response regulator NarL